MRTDHVIRLIVAAPYSGERWEMAVTASKFPVFGLRLAGEMELGVSGLSMDQAVEVLREREFRRDILVSAAKHLAHRMADYIEDREGWHGEQRQQRILQTGSKPSNQTPQDDG